MALGVGGKVVGNSNNVRTEEFRDYYTFNKYGNQVEEIPDSFKIAEINSVRLDGFLETRTSFAVGNKNVFMQAGFMRRSIGPFFDDGLVVSSRAPQTGNIFVHWRGKSLAATWGLFMLTSKQEYKKFNGIDDFEESVDYKFNKVFFYNSLSWYITPNIEFNVFESVMFSDFNLRTYYIKNNLCYRCFE